MTRKTVSVRSGYRPTLRLKALKRPTSPVRRIAAASVTARLTSFRVCGRISRDDELGFTKYECEPELTVLTLVDFLIFCFRL